MVRRHLHRRGHESDDGLPSDIVGQEISDVKSSLESKGYDVKVEKRLSSKQYIGKVSGSEPGRAAS